MYKSSFIFCRVKIKGINNKFTKTKLDNTQTFR